VRLRDRDAIITAEGIIFRVYGYTHPESGYICDVEYAPSSIFKSQIPKAFRQGVNTETYYKFFEDEGLRFVRKNYPRYQLFHEPLQEKVVGVRKKDIKKTRKPDQGVKQLLDKLPSDQLHKATLNLLKLVIETTCLKHENFGVFGSLLHGFYHPKFSDIDLIIYGKCSLKRLLKFLKDAYQSPSTPLQNEFKTIKTIEGKNWRFRNYSPKEFLWHQRRKLIYGLFKDVKINRIIKTEFEPVKEWHEIRNEYTNMVRITKLGWAKALVRVTDDSEAAFMPAKYRVETLQLSTSIKEKVESIDQIISYVEEFRMQAFKDEVVYVEGNLEQLTTSKKVLHQITLTRCPRYYEQVMKLNDLRCNSLKKFQ